MKNLINYYYGLSVINIKKIDKNYKFSIDGIEYEFEPCDADINGILDIYKYNYFHRIYCHEIVFNKDNSPITICDNNGYVLIKKINNDKSVINLNNIINYNFPIYINKKFNWGELWSKKIDYYEYQINQFGKKFPLIRDSFSYYNGMMETAISLANIVNKDNFSYYLNHRRITPNTNMDLFYNPLELVIDIKIRDACEYFKQKFFSSEFNFQEVESYLYRSNLTNSEAILFIARLLFPSYYFDFYDEIIQGSREEKSINVFIDKIDEYENFLYRVYLILKTSYQIPEIEWLKKM